MVLAAFGWNYRTIKQQLSNKYVHSFQNKKDGKDHESKQSSTTPDPGYHQVNFDGFW